MTENCIPLESLMVSISNSLIRQSQDLSLNEKRIIACCAAKIARFGYSGSVTLHAAEFAELFGLDLCNSYRYLKTASDSLYERSIVTLGGANDDLIRRRKRWISEDGVYKSGYIELFITPSLLPELANHSSNFTCYRLSQISGITCKFTLRLFELLCSWRSTGALSIPDSEFRTVLGIPSTYKTNKIHSRILTPSLPVVSEALQMNVTVEEVKSGRSVTGWKFQIKRN